MYFLIKKINNKATANHYGNQVKSYQSTLEFVTI